jgi:ATP-dependent helicase HrpB
MTADTEISRLPVFCRLDEIASVFAGHGTLLLHAEPGAGKTTLVPRHLLSDSRFSSGKILLLQPRRVAARASAERIASLLGERIGETVGIRTRIETIISSKTRLEVVTEGILTRIIQNDQSLGDYSTVIFDEFHERNLTGDLSLALAWDCRRQLRPDLRLMLMSATLPEAQIRAVFGDIPLLSIPGRSFPVETFFRPPLRDERIQDGAARLTKEALRQTKGDVLVFLPGHGEIRRTREALSQSAAEILMLHGSSTPEEQRRVLSPESSAARRVILSTNVAQTSLTIPGVTTVVDTGLERRVRFSPRTGMDHWETVPISQADAQQRRGRAGRTAPGVCFRWWQESEIRETDTRPEIAEADLSPLLLECAAWGASPFDLVWLSPPPDAAVRHARQTLIDLGFLRSGVITAEGERAAKLAIHPRLGRMLLDAESLGNEHTAALAAALLEDGDFLRGINPDFRERILAWERWTAGAPSMHERALTRIDTEAQRIVRLLGKNGKFNPDKIDADMAGILLLSAYPDRAARLTRSAGTAKGRFLLANGRGAIVQGALAEEEFLVVPDLDGGASDGRVFLAAPVSRGDLENGKAGPVTDAIDVTWNGWKPTAKTIRRVRSLILSERQGGSLSQEAVADGVIHKIAKDGIESLPWTEQLRRLRARISFLQHHSQEKTPDLSDLMLADTLSEWLIPYISADGKDTVTEDTLRTALSALIGWDLMPRLDGLVPEHIILPSGSSRPIDYESGEIPVLAARLQEFFGCRVTPEICGIPLLLHLLSPAGRPVQVTRDLDGFWDRAYPDVKKELSGRYPKHYWPENPREAEPTARAKPRK